ncbi:MAG: PIN domain-containing protein [Nanoarchaeota archaeon]
MTTYFYDSYAIIEYVRDNPSFREYFETHSGIMTPLNLLEVYYSILNEAGRETADKILDTLYPIVTSPTKEETRQAMIFRQENKKKDLSYADCLGYMVARSRNMQFLTGDRAFNGMRGVEFIK